MTVSEAFPASPPAATGASVPRAILLAFVPAFAALLLSAMPQLADPMIRYDDFPAFFREAALYWEKTLSEGRWLNYLWMKHAPFWPAPVGYVLYQFFWAIFAAGAAANALGARARPVYLGLLATFIALSPQNFLISGWFSTQLPSTIFAAVFAVVAALSTPRAGRWMFLATGWVSMLTYPTLPLLMLAILVTRHYLRRGLGDAVPGAEAAGVQNRAGLMFRLRQLSGQDLVFDRTPPEPCPVVPPFDPVADPRQGYLVEEVGGTVFVRLPATTTPVPGR